jgi:hypothetical protein
LNLKSSEPAFPKGASLKGLAEKIEELRYAGAKGFTLAKKNKKLKKTIKKKKIMGLWSSGYDATLTRWMSPVQIWAGPFLLWTNLKKFWKLEIIVLSKANLVFIIFMLTVIYVWLVKLFVKV